MFAVACGDDDGGRTRDSGMLTLMDSGTITLPDTGTMMGSDSGMTTTWPAECREPFPTLDMQTGSAAIFPRCAASTAECVDACADSACIVGCLDADTTPADEATGVDCSTCFLVQYYAALSASGCQTQVGEYFCCIDPCEDEACVNAMCSAEVGALEACEPGSTFQTTFGMYAGSCFGS
jgi:hypothetical protein